VIFLIVRLLDHGLKLCYFKGMSWLKYLQETLGVRSVLWPQALAHAASEEVTVEPEKKSLVVFVDVQQWSRQEADLFDKMRAAMKLSKDQTKILFAGPGEMAQKSVELLAATCVIFFSPELATQAQSMGSDVLQMTTFGPRELISNPQLKKQTWDDLQKVMKKLN
jgi:hypothetical protein